MGSTFFIVFLKAKIYGRIPNLRFQIREVISYIISTGNNTQFLNFGTCGNSARGIAKPIPRPASYSLHHTLLACGQPYLTGVVSYSVTS